MELNKLYKIAENEKINIINFDMKNKAIIGCVNNHYCIGVNYSKIRTSSEEKTILAEELGHYYCNSLYNSNYSKEEISKKEFRALKWSFKVLVPYTKLKELAKDGCTYISDFAERLGVEPYLVEEAYNYYLENNLLKI